MQQKFSSHIFKGCTIAVLYILYDVVITFTKINSYEWANFIAWAIIILGVAVAVQLFVKVATNNTTFAVLFSHGFKTAAVATCLIFIYTLVMVYIVNPQSIYDKAVLLMEQAKKNNQVITREVKQNTIKITRLITIAGIIMGTLVLGLIGAIIGAVSANKTMQHNNN